MEDILLEEGHSVTLFQDGLSAWEEFNSQKDLYDLIISDLVMPGGGGKKLLTKVFKQRPNQSFFILSGYAQFEELSDFIPLANFKIIKKPFDVLNFIQMVNGINLEVNDKNKSWSRPLILWISNPHYKLKNRI